jgi:membrane-bound lytic murein transglycosylase D
MRSQAIIQLLVIASVCLGCAKDYFGKGSDADRLASDRGEFSTADFEDLMQQREKADDFSADGFCRDDVYAKYLRNKYIKENSYRSKKFRSRRSRRSMQKKVELEASHYARERLQGPVTPFFGAMPVIANERVEIWLRYFKNRGRNTFLKWLVRAESIKEVVLPLLRQEGLPEEVFYLGMIESGFNYRAFSHASASGPWQFMRGTAAIYGLKMNYWVDERRDPIKSTVAAARYLRDMYKRFGDWWLAMASYNAGPGKISRAIRKSKSRDFWKIANTKYIRSETKHYVPKVLAAVILASNPAAHGFDVASHQLTELPSGSVLLDRPYKVREIALSLGVSRAMIQQWNPEIVRSITPPTKRYPGGYSLRIPLSLQTQLMSALPTMSNLRIADVKMYRIRRGDTLSHIARRYGVAISRIRRMNPRVNLRTLRIGKSIAIPIPDVQTL